MSLKINAASHARTHAPRSPIDDGSRAREPFDALKALLDRVQRGGPVDPATLRGLLGRIDAASLETLARALLPERMHPNARAFFDARGSSSWGGPRPSPCSSADPRTQAWDPASAPVGLCFPTSLTQTFRGATCAQPSWECVPNKPGKELEDCFLEDPDCHGTPHPDAPEKTPATGKTFDVWFEHRDGQKTKQRSPIVLDLNGNGRPELTGDVGVENGRWVAKGGGKVDFDLDPSKRSWKTKSVARRPGSGAPKVPGGTAKIYDASGALIAENVPLKDAMKRGKKGLQEGRAEVYDATGNLVGELKRDERSGKMMYHWGNRQDAERTEWMAPGGADGLLAWDVNGDGKINGVTELFGEFDTDGTKRFQNGYEKLAAYFDEDQNGRVDGAELANAAAKGVRVWRDVDGDAQTDAGELDTLDAHGIRSLGVTVDEADLSSTFDHTGR